MTALRRRRIDAAGTGLEGRALRADCTLAHPADEEQTAIIVSAAGTVLCGSIGTVTSLFSGQKITHRKVSRHSAPSGEVGTNSRDPVRASR